MSKRVFFILLIMLITIPIFAQSATVQRVSGKVELMKSGGNWAAVAAGDSFPIGATISTGFRSSAVLLVADSEITVLPLTRMAIDDLIETQTTVTTNLNLRTGKVRALVRTTEGKTADFKLRSPVSTAAVRGTEFLFDGYRLEVIEGVVQFFNTVKSIAPAGGGAEGGEEDDEEDSPVEDGEEGNEGVFVTAGNGSETDEGGVVKLPEDNQRLNTVVSADTSTAADDVAASEEEIIISSPPPTTGNLVIIVGTE